MFNEPRILFVYVIFKKKIEYARVSTVMKAKIGSFQ